MACRESPGFLQADEIELIWSMYSCVCVRDDVVAAESGLAGFLRKGRDSRDRHTERKKRKTLK